MQEGLRTHNRSCKELLFKTVSGLFTFIDKLFLSFSDEDDDIYECKADGEKFKRSEVHSIGSMIASFSLLSTHTFDSNQSFYHYRFKVVLFPH